MTDSVTNAIIIEQESSKINDSIEDSHKAVLETQPMQITVSQTPSGLLQTHLGNNQKATNELLLD